MGSYSYLLKPFLLAKVTQEVRLANILYGEHADELSVLSNGQRPKATLLEDVKTVLCILWAIEDLSCLEVSVRVSRQKFPLAPHLKKALGYLL